MRPTWGCSRKSKTRWYRPRDQLINLLTQPLRASLCREDHRHPVVYLGAEIVWSGRDDRERRASERRRRAASPSGRGSSILAFPRVANVSGSFPELVATTPLTT